MSAIRNPEPVAHPIDATLALLRDAMTTHRRALAPSPPLPPYLDVPPPHDGRPRLAQRLLAALETRAGIEISDSAFEKLARTLKATTSADLAAWIDRLELLPANDPEWLSLIEVLTVHETYVMRDPSQLLFFAGRLPQMIDEAATRSFCLRIWSVGCATGEEVYSIAALVLDAMVATGHASVDASGTHLHGPWTIEIVGSDISRSVLAHARSGVYDTGPLSSFREESAVLLHHFPLAPERNAHGLKARVASADLKAVVRFEQFNLAGDPVPTSPFDAVVCRNVLIYFSARARLDALGCLGRAVRDGGYLLLGPTDFMTDTTGFETLWAPDAVMYRRRRENA